MREHGQNTHSCTKTQQTILSRPQVACRSHYRQLKARRALPGIPEKRPWLRGLDLNQRPLGYEPNELPDCSTPRKYYNGCLLKRTTTSFRNVKWTAGRPQVQLSASERAVHLQGVLC